ncbi:LacI family DNA-binding transcriptional regulator [Variovorax sp. E3]|uniref:LacI family DNA-binding transcriptional regulator n=1 Tax=Variovorax sp. E3 TaxID=1914993 RepID=UPI0018DB28E4|nr:LacI family DNA-binding transcriptional regulator [Variovorax sp. E3]
MLSTTTKRPTVEDVARKANVSVATVSRVLANVDPRRFSAETAERVRKAAREMNYQPSELGRSLRTATARAAALLVPDTTNEFCADVASSLEGALQRNGLSMMLCNTAEDPAKQDAYLEQIESRGISAIVLQGVVESPALLRMSAGGTPMVFVSRRPPDPVKGDFVGVDNRGAGADVADHFLSKGYEDCAAIHGSLRYAASRERLIGFSERLGQHGVSLVAERRIQSQLTPEAGHRHARALLSGKSPPRAIFCGNDSIAYGVYRAAIDMGLRVPNDLAIFGFDDNRLNRWLAPWLSTVHVPVSDFGEAVAGLLKEQSLGGKREPRTVLLPHSLAIRESA